MAQVHVKTTVAYAVVAVVVDPEVYVCFGEEGLVPFDDHSDLVVFLQRISTG